MDDHDRIALHKIDAFDDWVNGAYDETGDAAICVRCGEEMKWNPIQENWYCPACEEVMDRPTYFNHIGAEPPGPMCMNGCSENYPFCKKHCEHYDIDPNDPMLD